MTGRDDENREDLLLPILLPVGALIVIGSVLFLFSRVLLRVDSTWATGLALATAVAIMAIATFVASRKHVSGGALLSMVGGILGFTMLAGGVALLAGLPKAETGGEAVVLALAAPQGAATKGYDKTALSAPAGSPFTIEFDNQDPNVPHNVDIEAEGQTTPLFEGELITGVAKATYSVDPLDPGTYQYFCKVHPTTMKGTLTVAEGAPPSGGGTGGGALTVSAQGLKFDTAEIDLQAGVQTQLTFDNKDAGTPHNIAIFTDDTLSTVLFRGDLVTGPGSITYTIPALDPGEYYFHCDVHPNMNGKVVVTGGSGATGSGSGSASPAAPTSVSPSG
jgi:plastocyanin